jgi:hypothetical protein
MLYCIFNGEETSDFVTGLANLPLPLELTPGHVFDAASRELVIPPVILTLLMGKESEVTPMIVQLVEVYVISYVSWRWPPNNELR